MTDLEILCQEHKVSLDVLKKLIAIEKNHIGYKIRRGLFREFEKTLIQDWVQIGYDDSDTPYKEGALL
jgi:hypothetical protein